MEEEPRCKIKERDRVVRESVSYEKRKKKKSRIGKAQQSVWVR